MQITFLGIFAWYMLVYCLHAKQEYYSAIFQKVTHELLHNKDCGLVEDKIETSAYSEIECLLFCVRIDKRNAYFKTGDGKCLCSDGNIIKPSSSEWESYRKTSRTSLKQQNYCKAATRLKVLETTEISSTSPMTMMRNSHTTQYSTTTTQESTTTKGSTTTTTTTTPDSTTTTTTQQTTTPTTAQPTTTAPTTAHSTTTTPTTTATTKPITTTLTTTLITTTGTQPEMTSFNTSIHFTKFGPDGSIYTLVKHHVKCPTSQALVGFKLQRNNDGNKIRYKYVCTEIPATCKQNSNTIPGKDNGQGRTTYLGRLNVRCYGNDFMTSYHYQRKDDQSWYDYDCCSMKNQDKLECFDLDTPKTWHNIKKVIYLDRQNVRCPDHYAISSFRLKGMPNKEQTIQYVIKCCPTDSQVPIA